MTMLALAATGWSGSAAAVDIVHESLVSTDGWAQNSLNATSFRQSSVTSHDGWQFIGFVDGDERVVLGKRQLGTDTWQLHVTQYTVDATDAHNSVNIGIDGNGYLHVIINGHHNPFTYAKAVNTYSTAAWCTAIIITNKTAQGNKKPIRSTCPKGASCRNP